MQPFPVETVEPLVLLNRLQSVNAVPEPIGRVLSMPTASSIAGM